MIVVTGSTGAVGRLVAEELARRGEPMRLLVRDPSRAPELAGAEVVEADYGRAGPPGRRAARGRPGLHGLPARGAGAAGAPAPLVHRDRCRCGVAQIVYLSFLNAGAGARFLHARSHGATEEMLAESGVPFTSIRNGMYADDIPGWFDPDGVLREPGEDARITFSYRPELAQAIAATLTEPGHEGQVYDITTPPSVTLAELARIASDVSGRDYRYEPVGDDVLGRSLARSSVGPAGSSRRDTRSYEALRAGELDVRSDDFRQLTGARAALGRRR